LEYSYPLSLDWDTEEIITVINFYEVIERAYESGAKREEIINAYQGFKNVIPSKAEEKAVLKEFEAVSNYSSYHVVKEAKSARNDEIIKGTLK